MIDQPQRSFRRAATLVVGALLALVAVAAGAEPARTADGDEVGAGLRRAEAELAAGRAAAAETAYRQLLEGTPGLLDAHRGLAEALVALGRTAEAAERLATVGDGLVAAGRPADAVAWLERAAHLRPEAATLHARLGRALALAQRSAAAAPVLERAVALGDRDPSTRLYLAAARWEAGDPDAAEPLLRELAESEGKATEAVTAAHRLGRLLAWRGDPAAALPWLERAAAARPTAPDVLLDRARALAAVGRDAEAIAAFEHLTRLAPELPAAWYGLGRALLRSDAPSAGDRDAATAALDRHRQLYAAEQRRTRDQGRLRAALDRGWQLLASGDAPGAIAHFATLGESPEALAGAAAGHRALGRPRAAAALLERAVALAPERQDLALLLDDARRAAESATDTVGGERR